MFEKRHEPLLKRSLFFLRLTKSFLFGIFFILAALLIGMWGFTYFENMPWIESFLNATMLLSGEGPYSRVNTFGGQIFAGLYALFSGIGFLLVVGIIFAPILHRFFHKFHLEIDEEERQKNKLPKYP